MVLPPSHDVRRRRSSNREQGHRPDHRPPASLLIPTFRRCRLDGGEVPPVFPLRSPRRWLTVYRSSDVGPGALSAAGIGW